MENKLVFISGKRKGDRQDKGRGLRATSCYG